MTFKTDLVNDRGITRGGRKILLRSRSWATLPAEPVDGRIRLAPQIIPLWPEYGRLLPLLNWYQRIGFELVEHRGPGVERGNEIVVDRRVTLIGPVPTVAEFSERWELPSGTTAETIPAIASEPRGLRIRDGVQAGDSRYRIDLRFAPQGTSTLARDAPDRAVRDAVPLRNALRTGEASSAAWGHLPGLINAMRSVGGRVHTSFGRYRRLSGLVEHTAGARVAGHEAWAHVIENADLPDGMVFENLGDGFGLVRDIPGGFASDHARFALVLEP